MKRSIRTSALVAGLGIILGLVELGNPTDKAGDFSKKTIDIGLVVSDAAKSAAFYTEVLGFTEAPGFSVDADLCGNSGLTDHKPASVRVFLLGEGDASTKLKLIEMPDSKPKTSDNSFIDSQLGFSYITVFVMSMTSALERLSDAGLSPLAKGPVSIGSGDEALLLGVVRDPDGNLIELIGPK